MINAVDRYYVPNQSIAEDEDWSIIMRHVAANLDESVHRLNEALIDHLVLGMSSQSFMGGVEGSFALLDHLRKVSGSTSPRAPRRPRLHCTKSGPAESPW